MNRIYMDNAATTRMRPEVLEAMMPYLTDRYGNPSSIHEEGRRARQAVEKAREQVRNALGAGSEDHIYFTSGATEANNLALHAWYSGIYVTGTEHLSVMNSRLCPTFLPLTDGIVNLLFFKREIVDCCELEDALVSVAVANNESGAVQPIKLMAECLSGIKMEGDVYFHLDATQAVGHVPIFLPQSPFHYELTLSAHKFGGPKGIGALISTHNYKNGMWAGGHQENGVRPGTENVAGIVGLGKAIELATQNLDEKKAYISSLSRKLCEGILSDIESAWLNGPPIGVNRLPGNVNISFAGCRGEAIVLALDEAGVAVSSGSACSSGSGEPSHVLMRMYNDKARANASVRFSLDENNTMEEVDYVLSVLPGIVERVRDNENH